MKNEFLGKRISGPFTVPSGIVTCSTNIIRRFFELVPEVGVLTTKSIGPEPREGYREPILTQYEPGSFTNAVGLTNPGVSRSAELLAELSIPKNKFLLISIFGASVEEYVNVAKELAPHGDGLELNLSCPHAKGLGMAMGQDPALVEEIVSSVKAAVSVPVVAKLTPNVPDIGLIAEAAEKGGADAICAINTMGPEQYNSHGFPILSNKKGGVSGKGIMSVALEGVARIREVVSCPIIACGGLSGANDVRQFQQNGASIIGIGSALVGMTTAEIANYFQTLTKDLENQTDESEGLIRYDIDMEFRPVKLVKNERITEDICILTFDRKVEIQAGQFVFLWIPGLGEKPFSALVDDPFKLAVINLGSFTNELMTLEPGTEAYVRGPHGNPVKPPSNSRIIAVAGGTGLAAVYQLARDFGNTDIYFGARSKDRLYFIEESTDVSNLHISTDDGSYGAKGLITELLEENLEQMSLEERESLVFYNCGPAPMVRAAEALQRKYVHPNRINNAIDYLTKCGVGICGACDSPEGRRLCVDGPFLDAADTAQI